MSPTAPRPRAQRLDPAERRTQILECAAELLMRDGLSNCSLEAVAKASGVSKPLVYKYFANRDALLSALLHREFEFIHGRRQPAAADDAPLPLDTPIDTVLEIGVERYLGYILERGRLFRMLADDAGVSAQVSEELRAGQRMNMRYWTDHLGAAYPIPFEFLRAGVILTSHALEGAEAPVKAGKVSEAELAEFWTTFIQAGWRAVGEKYGVPGGSLPG